jgi:predicted membrane channel-forming protein YqfA (hemolysin III family)
MMTLCAFSRIGDTHNMLLVAIAWIYVVLMMALVEAMSPGGTVFGALITLVLYGVLPLGIVLYLMSAPARRRLRLRREGDPARQAASVDPGDGGEHAAGDAIAAERKEA